MQDEVTTQDAGPSDGPGMDAAGRATPDRAAEDVPGTPDRHDDVPELPAREPGLRRVVLLVNDVPPGVVRGLLEPYRGAEIFVVAPRSYDEWRLDGLHERFLRSEKPSNASWYLKLWGPVDVLVNARAALPRQHAEMMAELLFHLAPGGMYVLPRTALTAYRPGNPLEKLLHRLDGALVRGFPDDAPVRDRELAEAVTGVDVSRDEIRLVKRGRHHLKLSDRWANRMLGTRNPDLRLHELRTLPAQTFVSGTEIVSHGASREMRGLDTTVEVPPLHLRHYEGRVGLVSNALAFTRNEILPDSFRHHLQENLTNPRVIDVDRSFARIPRHVMPTEEVAGSYYLLDAENSGHFGHLMTEVVSRLWGWDAAKADDPDLRAVFRIRHPNERDPRLEKLLLTAFGIAEEDIVWIDHAVYVESLYAATPMFHNARPHYVHPQIRETWQRIRAGLPADPGPTWDKVFVSRPDAFGNRRCLNRPEVERRFADAGFHVVYPEQHSLGRQAEIFARARVVAGFAGSALFNTLFADRLERLVVIGQEAYTARNEILIALPLDVRVDYFWNRPEVEHPEGRWSRAAYKSDWTFDLHRHRHDLDRVLHEVR
ncbi:capsular polysaccharide biosynthesis protein [Isoptericola jiangsuensis]|uniref:Capsular polysaccharide biosynthesis protein n=1 Tax=Isoptericola jiangsuensis TaxID=548579 RepID=A0A2A9EX04_9MICO|nr:glycosyltransferase 61 family protein [Isoptericola jiangsuensis]PFG43554.1 capsular polysaccharide biosynthesis protein [Isoptericola jiangsuensis]